MLSWNNFSNKDNISSRITAENATNTPRGQFGPILSSSSTVGLNCHTRRPQKWVVSGCKQEELIKKFRRKTYLVSKNKSIHFDSRIAKTALWTTVSFLGFPKTNVLQLVNSTSQPLLKNVIFVKGKNYCYFFQLSCVKKKSRQV